MKPSADLPALKIVETSRLHPHELPDEQRAQPLVSALRRDRVLKNPPIVQPIEGRDEFVVLDGANRVTALRLLGTPHCLVQVAQPSRELVEVKTWNHVLMGLAAEEARQLIHKNEQLGELAKQAVEAGIGTTRLVRVDYAGGERVAFGQRDLDLRQRIARLNRIVDTYRGQVHFERTSESSLAGINGMYEAVAALVIFPEFEPDEVVQAAAQKWHFPPGITRFIVSPRALRLNYPLAMFNGMEDLAEKQKNLDTWIRSRVRNRRVRFYAESTFMFDE